MSIPSKSILTKLTVRQLPLPGTALACHTMRQGGNVSVRDVVRVLATDPISALSILKRANEAYYGLQGTVSSLTHAVEILGIEHVLIHFRIKSYDGRANRIKNRKIRASNKSRRVHGH